MRIAAAILLSLTLAACTSRFDRNHTPTKFQSAEAAAKLECKESAEKWGRFASVADELCEQSKSERTEQKTGCISQCIDECAAQPSEPSPPSPNR